MGIALSPGSQ